MMITYSYIFIAAVEWICWLNGQRKKAPTPEVTQYFFHDQLNLFASPLIGKNIGDWCATHGLISIVLLSFPSGNDGARS